jgi:putative protease
VHAEDSLYSRDCDFVGIVREALPEGGWLVEGRNRIQSGDSLEIIGPAMRQAELVFAGACDAQGGKVETVQPNAMVQMTLPDGTMPGDLLRRWHDPVG